MFKKLIVLYLSFYLVLPGIISMNSVNAQDKKEYKIPSDIKQLIDKMLKISGS